MLKLELVNKDTYIQWKRPDDWHVKARSTYKVILLPKKYVF